MLWLAKLSSGPVPGQQSLWNGTLCLFVCVCVCVPVPLSTVSIAVLPPSQCSPRCLPVHVLLKIQMFYVFYVSYIKVHLFYIYMLPAELDTTVTTTTATAATTKTASCAQIVMHVTVEKYANAAKVEVDFFPRLNRTHLFSLALSHSKRKKGSKWLGILIKISTGCMQESATSRICEISN